jgi:CRP/FNR family transcriptional regulator
MKPVDCLKDPQLAVHREVVQTDLLRKIVIFKDLSQKSLSIIEKRIQTLELKKGD